MTQGLVGLGGVGKTALALEHPHRRYAAMTGRCCWRTWRVCTADQAVIEFGQLLADQVRVLGPDHPDTLRTRSSQARWLGEAGHVDQAVTEFGQLLADQVRVLGPDHPDTLRTRSSQVHWREILSTEA